LEGVDAAVVRGESGGVGCSSGLIGLEVLELLRSRLSGIAMFLGDVFRFPVKGTYEVSIHSGGVGSLAGNS